MEIQSKEHFDKKNKEEMEAEKSAAAKEGKDASTIKEPGSVYTFGVEQALGKGRWDFVPNFLEGFVSRYPTFYQEPYPKPPE